MASPYEMVLGDRLDALHPQLRAYFAGIPEGSVGRGHGVFDRVGTPKRWLWPVLAVLGIEGIAFPVWERDVPFEVENRPVRAKDGSVAVSAIRTFRFHTGTQRMIDAITAEATGLVDHLGPHRLLSAELEARVVEGRLEMRSGSVRIGRGVVGAAILPSLRPTVVLTERYDDVVDKQHVSIVLSLPVIGTIYEYSGYFTYAIAPEGEELS